MFREAAVRAVLAAAKASEGAQEVPSGSNAGAYVERVLSAVGCKKGDPWCCAAVYDWLAAALDTENPMPATAGCQAFYEWAEQRGIVSTEAIVGCAFVVWHPELKRFAHTGLVVALPALTISGNTTVPGQGGDSREGWRVVKKSWKFKPEDRYIHWQLLFPPTPSAA